MKLKMINLQEGKILYDMEEVIDWFICKITIIYIAHDSSHTCPFHLGLDSY